MILKSNKGVAILVTLSFMALAVTATLELHRRARAAVSSTALARDRLLLEQMAETGIQAGLALLLKDKTLNDIDTLGDIWADPEIIAEMLGELKFDNGTLAVAVTDEMSRIQINALVQFPEGSEFNEAQRELWDRFLLQWIETNEIQDVEIQTLINSIKDWLDSGDDNAITGLSGAESEYYEDLDPPYVPANGPVRHGSEIGRIKGFTPDLVNRFEEVEGLKAYLTVFGVQPGEGTSASWNGRININTAGRPVISALLPVESRDLAESILQYRQELEETEALDVLSTPKWYQNAAGAADVEIDPNLIALTSDVFRIESKASLNDSSFTVIAIVQRQAAQNSGQWAGKALRWQTK